MKPISAAIEDRRVSGPPGELCGAFVLKHGNALLAVLVSDGMGWDHVSVSLKTRCPTWEEMCWVKDQFFAAEECVMQLHPPKADYVNNHPFCLHLWRPQTEPEMALKAVQWGDEWDPSWTSPGEIPRPPAECVGVQSLGLITPRR